MQLSVPQQQSLGLAGGAPSPQGSSGSATGSPRSKVALKPGHSLMDWIRLGKSGCDLTGVGGRRLEVTDEQLAKHNTQEDFWMALKGKVYNVTPYLDFHPGGVPELLRGVGSDATHLFNEVHKWVNFESMLSKCYIGKYVGGSMGPPPSRRAPTLSTSKSLSLSTNSLKLNADGGRAVSNASLQGAQTPGRGRTQPRYEWFQSESTVTVVLYTKWKAMRHENVIIDRKGPAQLTLTCVVEDFSFIMALDLENELKNSYKVSVSRPSGKVEVVFDKAVLAKQWTSLGAPQDGHQAWHLTSSQDTPYRSCSVASVKDVTHDTKLLCLGLPEGTRMCIPLGYHVHVKHSVEGMDVSRSYTVVPHSLTEQTPEEDAVHGRVLHLMIKVYPDGALSSALGRLDRGDTLQISHFDGNFEESRLDECCHLVMYAAGTGFTPMACLIHRLLDGPQHSNKPIQLIFFNKEERDILWKDQLDSLAKQYSNFSVEYVLSQPHPEWTGLTGRVRQELVEECIPVPVGEGRTNILFCACGPVAFTEEAIRLAKEEGYTDDMVHAFLA